MNKKIKFRVWDKREKAFVSNNLVAFALDDEGEVFFVELNVRDRKRNDFVIQQYTGLKDKNNKEIYQ